MTVTIREPSELQINVGPKTVHVTRGINDRFWDRYAAWEPETKIAFERFIDASHSYIDIGAWIGPTLLFGCQLARRAYGIEPDPIAYAELATNVNCNQPLTNNVHLFNICIAPLSGEISFGSRGEGGDSMSSLLFPNGKTRWIVDGVNFPEWIQQNEIEDCNFIKIDIEGGEYSILPSMVAYLKSHRPTLCLSLHPCFLGDPTVRGMRARLKRSVSRLGNTARILKLLSFYRYWYDPFGKGPVPNRGSSLRARLHIYHRVANLSWKPLVFLVVCLLGLGGRSSAVVMTDHKW